MAPIVFKTRHSHPFPHFLSFFRSFVRLSGLRIWIRLLDVEVAEIGTRYPTHFGRNYSDRSQRVSFRGALCVAWRGVSRFRCFRCFRSASRRDARYLFTPDHCCCCYNNCVAATLRRNDAVT